MEILGICVCVQESEMRKKDACMTWLFDEMRNCFRDFFVYETEKELVTGYRDALLEVYLKHDLDKYEKVCVFSNKLYGPLYSGERLCEIFPENEKMWGLIPEQNNNKKWIQEDFLLLDIPWILNPAVWKTIMNDFDWVKNLCSWNEWSCFISGERINNSSKGAFPYDMFQTENLIREGLPFLRRGLFEIPYEKYITYGTGESLRKSLEYIQENTKYPVEYIWKDLLENYYLADLKELMQLEYILPKDGSVNSFTKKVAVIVHMYYMELLSQMVQQLKVIPKEVDIHISVGSIEKKLLVEQACETEGIRVSIYVVTNRGRDLAAFLEIGRIIQDDYDYLCFLHDKKSLGNEGPIVTAASFMWSLWENLLSSKNYICSVIEKFEQNPCLGILAPPTPLHNIYFYSLGREWTACYEEAERILDRLGINCPISEEKHPFVLGSAFWFRKQALLPLFVSDLSKEDFPEEPMPMDGTFSHGLERAIPFIAQSQGYYSAWVMSDDYAKCEIENLNYMLRGFVSEEQKKNKLSMSLYYKDAKQKIRFGKKAYLYLDTGMGYTQEQVCEALIFVNSKFEFGAEFDISRWKDVKRVRLVLDLGEKIKRVCFNEVKFDDISCLWEKEDYQNLQLQQDTYEWAVTKKGAECFSVTGQYEDYTTEELYGVQIRRVVFYVDQGSGFSENNSIYHNVMINKDGSFRICLDGIDKYAGCDLRIDWKNTENSCVFYKKVNLNGQKVKLKSATGIKLKKNHFVEKLMPIYYCEIPEGKGGIVLEGYFYTFGIMKNKR